MSLLHTQYTCNIKDDFCYHTSEFTKRNINLYYKEIALYSYVNPWIIDIAIITGFEYFSVIFFSETVRILCHFN